MSGHMMYVWDKQQGNPSSIQEAISILNQLENAPAQLNSALYDFAQTLQLQAEESFRGNHDLGGNVEFVENFLNKKQQINTAVLKLFLPMEDNFEIMQLVVETAKLTKVVIFDDRYGLLFLPSGQILPHDRASVYLEMCQLADEDIDEGYDLPQKEMEFAAWIEPYLNKLFGSEGFKKVAPTQKIIDGDRILVKHIYQQDIAKGCQQLHFIYIRYQENYNLSYDGGYTVAVNLDLYLPDIMEVYKASNFKIIYEDNLTFSIQSSNFFDYKLVSDTHRKNLTIGFSNPVYIFSPLYSRAMVIERLIIYHQIFKPLIELSKDIKGLNEIINGKETKWRSFSNHLHENHLHAPKCLILARLANAINYNDLINELKCPKSLEKLNKEAKRRQDYNASYRYLIEYLENFFVE